MSLNKGLFGSYREEVITSSEGQLNIPGFVTSFIIIVCVILVVFPASSVTLYVLVIVSGAKRPSEMSETNATTGDAVQLSVSSEITSTSGEGISPVHSTLIEVGLDAVGLVTSLIVIVCVILVVFPASSVTLYVLVIVSGAKRPSEMSETNATTGDAVQLSVSSEITDTFGRGTSDKHSTLRSAGEVACGFWVSIRFIVCSTVVEFPQSSVIE